MNKIYKVIYNRARNMYQVVSEIVHSRGKTRSLQSQNHPHGLARLVTATLLAMSIGMPVGWAADGGTTTTTASTKVTENNPENITGGDLYTEVRPTSGTYIAVGNTTAANLISLDNQVKVNADAITANTTSIVTNTTNITNLTNTVGTISAGNYIKSTDSIATNLGTLDTQVNANTDAIGTNKSNIAINASDISNLKNLSNISDAGNTVIKKQAKKAVKVAASGNATVSTSGSEDDDSTLTYTINVANNGVISAGDTDLVSGGTLYTELRPTSGKYISADNTTAANLIALDANLVNVVNALGLDVNDTTKSYTSKLSKYFKVNPQITTEGTTTTYAPDAAANGTNAVAIGPSAQAGESTTDTSTSTTTVTGGTSSTAVGDSAKANGNQSVALGYNAQVLNTTDTAGATTATVSGGVAIGNGAKVNGTSDAAAIGTGAQVNETATGGIAIGKNAVTGEDKGTVTVGDTTANVAAIGGTNSVALGTSAKASGSEALALGKGAQVNNYTTQAGTTVTKTLSTGSAAIGDGATVTGANDALALGAGATITGTGTNSDNSMALGKSAKVTNATDAIAEGTNAAVADGANNGIALGNTAKANTSNTTAIGYNASATGAGAVAIGENTVTSLEGGVSIGSGTSASGKSIVIGYATDSAGTTKNTESQNTDAIAIGNGAQANSNDSVSIGHQAGMNTSQSRTSGYGSLIAIGTNAGNNVKGMQNVALGSGAGSNVKSSYNVAIGSNAGAGINYAADKDTNPQNGYNISIGTDANYQSADANAKNIMESIAIGHSANAVSNAMALGYSTTASGDKSMALGYNATAADTDSIAIGDKASAGGGNIAIGSGSLAPSITTYGTSYLTNNTNVDGYVSLGGQTSATTSKTILRRISNVADGSADQDAVTVAQLKAAYTDLEGTIKTTDTKISDTYTQSAIDTKIANVESKITNAQTKYFSINTSSDTLTANADNSGATTEGAADAMAIGPNATATKAKAVAIGNNVLASGKGSIAIGTADNPATSTTVTTGGNTSANPHVTSAEGSNSVAVGTSSIAQTDNSVAIGTRASVYTSDVTDSTTGTTTKVGQQSIAIGYQAETRNTNAISIGSDAKAYRNGSTAVGHSAFAQGADSVVVGTSSTANGANAGILGKSNTINGDNTYAVGSENNVNGNWGAVTYSNINGSKNTITPISDTSGSTVHGMSSLSVTGNSNTISQGSYSDTVSNISILGNSNSVSGANTDSGNAGTTTNITVIGGSNTIAGKDGAGSDGYGIGTWKTLERTTVIGYGNTVNQAGNSTLSSLANTQILGNDVTATLGNSVYLGTKSAAATANLADSTTLTEAETKAADAVDTTGKTDTEIATAQAEAKAKARYATNLKTMKESGTTAGLQTLNTDTTYDDGTSYTYAGSSAKGVITVGSVGGERRIQNVAAGLVSANSTDAVNGSQLYALTRQLRFGGDNSTFGTTSTDDKNVIARGSAQTLAITGGAGVTTTTTDGVTTTTVDTTKLTNNNIGVIANTDTNALNVKLASDLTSLHTAQLGSGTGTDYKETIKLDGTGTNGGTLTLDDANGANGVTLRTSGSTTTKNLAGTASTRLLVNDKTVATMEDGLTVGGDSGKDSQLKLNSKLTIKGGINSSNAANRLNDKNNNIGVTSDGSGTLTVKLSKDIALGNLQTGTETTDRSGTLRVNGSNYYSIDNGSTLSFFKSAGTADGSSKSPASGDTLGVTIGVTPLNGGYIGLFDGNGANEKYIFSGDTVDGIPRIQYNNGTKTGTTYSLATLNDGTNYKDDAGNSVSVALNKTLTLSGGATTDSTNTAANWTTGNISVVSSADTTDGTANGNGTMSIRLAKNLDLSSDGSLKTGNTTINNSGLTNGSTTLNGTGLTITDGPSVTTSGITANGKIVKVTAGTDDTDAANYAQIKAATTEVVAGDNVASVAKTQGTNKQNIYTVNVDNLAVKTTDGEKKTVTLANGLVFADGTNTTATVGDNGTIKYNVSNDAIKAQAKEAIDVKSANSFATVNANTTDPSKTTFTITATHNKLTSGEVTTAATADSNAVTMTLKDADGNTVTTSGLKDTYTTISKDATAKTVKFHRNDGTDTTLSLSDFGAASTTDMDKAVAAATTEIKAGTNASLGTTTKDATDGHKIYTLNVDDLSVSQNNSKVGTGISLKNGLSFNDGTNTTASVTEDGKISFNVSDAAIKKQAKDAVSLTAGDNVTIGTPTETDTNKNYTISVANLKLQANGVDAGTRKLAEGLNFANGANTTAAVDANGKITYGLNDSITLSQVTTGNSSLSSDGLKITNGPSVLASGINAGNKVITDVASGGDTDTNAANISDVKRLVANASNTTTSTGFKVKGDDMTAKTVQLGKQLNVMGGAASNLTDGNVGVTTAADEQGNATLSVKLKKDINLGETGSVQTGAMKMNNAGITNGSMSLNATGLTITNTDASKQVSLTTNGVSMGSQRVQNVAAGTADTDAVNLKQLNDLQTQVTNSSWNLSGTDGSNQAVTAKIGNGKTVTYGNGNYTKSVVSKDDAGNATVKVDVTAGTLTANTNGTIASTDGVATTGDVAKAVNSAAWTIEDGANKDNAQQVKAGTVVSLNAGTNMSLAQNGTAFTYNLNKDLQDMSSVNTKDTKGNTAVLNSEGLKVSDTSGNVLTQHATEIRIHDASAKENDTSTDVVLKKDGLHNGGHKIFGVAAGDVSENSTDAVNGSQLYKLQQQVGSGWKITGDDTAQATNIGAGAQVSVKSGKYAKATVNKSDTGEYDVQTQAITTSNGRASTAGDGLATTEDVVNALNNSYWSLTSGQSGTGVASGTAVDNVTNGTTISINAGNNLMLTQSGNNFTYALNPVVTGMTTISFTGLGASDGKPAPNDLIIGYQNGGGANPNKGYYVTGLSNTNWDQSNYQGDRAATEAQLKKAIENVSAATGTGGFALTADTGANNGGDKKVSQTLGSAIAIQGDGTYDAAGQVVKEGNISTVAYTNNAGPTGAIKIKLNKNIDLTDQGSLTIGSSRIANGLMALSNSTDNTKNITLDSSAGTAAIGGISIDGAHKAVTGLSNTTWEAAKATVDVSAGGYRGSTRAATESQLAQAISTATTTAQNNELHVQAGTYSVKTTTDAATGAKTNSVAMNIVDGAGTVKGNVVINDVAKASDVGDTDKFAGDIMKQNGGQPQKTSVVEAVNNLNDKVNQRVGDNKYSAITSKDAVQDGDSSTTAIAKLNNRMTNIYSAATQHSSVSNTDGNLTIDSSKNNASGGTDYQIGLNKEKLDLGNVTIKGNEGSITAKAITAKAITADTFTAGNTVVNNDGVKIGDKSALTNDTLKVNGKTYVSGDGINANSQKITNVAAGENDGDAVNVKQVNELAERQNEAIGQNAANINQLDRAVNRLDSRINRVGAGAAALAALHPGSYDPDDKVDFSAGFGNYRGASAAAVGVYYHPDETTTMSVGASFGGGENMVNAGVTWKMGRDSGHVRAKAAPAAVPVQFVPANQPAAVPVSANTSTVKAPVVTTTTAANGQQVPIVAAYLPSIDAPVRAENDELKELLARQTAILEKLTDQKVASSAPAAPAVSGDDLYPDVPENHWAYDFVGKLAKAGAFKGCSVDDPENNPMLTRNDFAQILYTALKNGATKNPALNKDGGLNHMASEFRAELKNVKR